MILPPPRPGSRAEILARAFFAARNTPARDVIHRGSVTDASLAGVYIGCESPAWCARKKYWANPGAPLYRGECCAGCPNLKRSDGNVPAAAAAPSQGFLWPREGSKGTTAAAGTPPPDRHR